MIFKQKTFSPPPDLAWVMWTNHKLEIAVKKITRNLTDSSSTNATMGFQLSAGAGEVGCDAVKQVSRVVKAEGRYDLADEISRP
jgi:hypothetical protein